MGQGTETCDRPTEVSVIRFVSRNQTIENIAPKKDVYTCKQNGCGKVFTNRDEYRTHEALEALKIKFICREPGCGEELSDPGSMWRHYQEWHNNETHVFACPYTSCNSLHTTSNNLEEHIDSCHRQLSTLPIEPEIICLEGPEGMVDDEISKNEEEVCNNSMKGDAQNVNGQQNIEFTLENISVSTNATQNREESMPLECDENLKYNTSFNKYKSPVKKLDFPIKLGEFSCRTESSFQDDSKFFKSEELSMAEENFLTKYDTFTSNADDVSDAGNSLDKNVVFVSKEVTITKNSKSDISSVQPYSQCHRIDLGNLEKVFRSGFECDSQTIEESITETNSNCSEDEEYMPKKQRMSRNKQESYKCEVSGCGKMYKYISHYRHHQDSHKLAINTNSMKPTKPPKPRSGRASTVSFFLCKMPGCGAEVTNVTALWKHYQDNHANAKPPMVPSSKSLEIFRCKVLGCELEFNTTLALYKHFNEIHGSNFNPNTKTGSGSNFQFTNQMFHDEVTLQQLNFKTDIKANIRINSSDYAESDEDQPPVQTVKKESHG
ncbi:zinc finger protein GLI4-like [Diprion similis]|uniref:zinc finger protein GLI4-like n=1 Tax=Diprion similis TaxID=362088 RepID=UPI001EF7CA26|nr:zinc finger protein GLI4-like [Diprion similis]